MTKTKLIVAKLVLFDVALNTLRQIAAPSRRRHRLLAQAAVDFIETQLAQHGKKMRHFKEATK